MGCLSSQFNAEIKWSDSRQHGIHDWWVQISVSVQWIDIMWYYVFCSLFQEEIKVILLVLKVPFPPSSAMTPSKTTGHWLPRWGKRKKVMPWRSWTETLSSIGATSDNWGRGQYGYNKYQGVDTNHLNNTEDSDCDQYGWHFPYGWTRTRKWTRINFTQLLSQINVSNVQIFIT